ncbi:AAA family ATPase [Agathobaculum butyriciproducens]|nr:AAA family ATPase [Agathobaculum butyriciproducens]
MYLNHKKMMPAEYAGISGNPFTDALPSVLSQAALFHLVQSRPVLPDDWQQLEAQERRMLVQKVLTLFYPFAYIYDLYDAVSRALRSTYMTFHAIDSIRKVNAAVITANSTFQEMAHITQAECGAILGVPGIGKTSALKRCLSTMPQVLEHTKYDNKPFFCKQVLYLFVECPADCTIKSLGRNIAYALDNALGTSYADSIWRFTNESVGRVAMAIKQLCITYHIGIIILDEVQNLINNSRIGRQTSRLVKFLVELMNDTSTSIYLVGTLEAEDLFVRQDHLKRRTRGARLLPMQYDKTYRNFLNSIWPYQMTKNFTPLTENIAQLIYYASGGVTAYIIKIFMESQIRVIATGEECLSESAIITTIRMLAIERPVIVSEGISISDFSVEAETMFPPVNYVTQIETANMEEPVPHKGGRKPHPRSHKDLICLLQDVDSIEKREKILMENELLERLQ